MTLEQIRRAKALEAERVASLASLPPPPAPTPYAAARDAAWGVMVESVRDAVGPRWGIHMYPALRLSIEVSSRGQTTEGQRLSVQLLSYTDGQVTVRQDGTLVWDEDFPMRAEGHVGKWERE